jgi:hypothetical protein
VQALVLLTSRCCSPENVRNECDATVRLSHDELVHLSFGADEVVHHSGSLDTIAIALFFIPVITWQVAEPIGVSCRPHMQAV